MIFAAIPIKPFGVAKARLSSVLDAAQRSRLGRAVAARTAATAATAGAKVVIVTADHRVASWAKAQHLNVFYEDDSLPPGLNGAAATAVRHAASMDLAWAIVHADLPLATVSDLERVFAAAATGPVLVPSYDGGSNVVAGRSNSFAFSFGSGSFHRHLARVPSARVLTTPGLVLDLDTPRDLELARAGSAGRWLEDVLTGRSDPEQLLPPASRKDGGVPSQR